MKKFLLVSTGILALSVAALGDNEWNGSSDYNLGLVKDAGETEVSLTVIRPVKLNMPASVDLGTMMVGQTYDPSNVDTSALSWTAYLAEEHQDQSTQGPDGWNNEGLAQYSITFSSADQSVSWDNTQNNGDEVPWDQTQTLNVTLTSRDNATTNTKVIYAVVQPFSTANTSEHLNNTPDQMWTSTIALAGIIDKELGVLNQLDYNTPADYYVGTISATLEPLFVIDPSTYNWVGASN